MSESLKEFEKFIDRRIIVGRIETVDEELGTVEVSYISIEGFKTFNIPHPHFGTTSWIRSMPEVGTYVLIGMTQYKQFPEILKTFDPSERVRIALNHIRAIKPDPDPTNPKEIKPVDRILYASSPEGGLPYRKLRAGEQELMSKGKSSLWLSRRGYLLEKAGIVRRALDADKSTVQDWAAGHERLGMDASLENQLWDSEYFGIVRRPTKDETVIPIQDLLNNSTITEEIKANIHIEDKVTSKVKEMKSQVEISSKEYKTNLRDFKLANKNACNTLSQGDNPEPIQEEISKIEEKASKVLTSLNQLKFLMGQLKFIGAGFQYVQGDFNIALSNLDVQQIYIKDQVSSLRSKDNLREVFSSLQNLTEVVIPAFSVETQISKTFLSQGQYESSIASKLEETKAFSRIYLDKSLEITKKFAYPEPLLEDNEFCKEWRTTLSWKGQPGKLYEQIIGHVYDHLGDREKTPLTDLKTRLRRTIWADKPNEKCSEVEWVDVAGNHVQVLASSAKTGRHIVIPEGNDFLDVGKNLEVRAGGDSTERVAGNKKVLVVKDLIIEVENLYYKVRGTYQVDAKKIVLNEASNSIEKLKRTIQSIKASEYEDSTLIETITVGGEKVLVNDKPKRRFLQGNPLISSRQQEIEDALTKVGSVNSFLTLSGGNISTKANLHTFDGAVEMTKTLKAKGDVTFDSKLTAAGACNFVKKDFISHQHGHGDPKTGGVI